MPRSCSPRPDSRSFVRALVCLAVACALASGAAAAQAPTPGAGQPTGSATTPSDPVTLFPHSDTRRYWVSGQANVIMQWHPAFYAQYSGTNSLTPWEQSATTHVVTLYTGYELTHNTEVFADIEDATGAGIGNANGLAGYTDMDSVRLANGVALSKGPYLARFMLRQIIPLTHGPRRCRAATSFIWPLLFPRAASNFAWASSTWLISSIRTPMAPTLTFSF